MATRTVSAAGGNWQTAGTWVEAAVPTAADDVVVLPAGASGQLTLNSGTCSCRSADFTGYTNTLTHSSGVTWAIGDGTTGHLKLVAGMTYAPAGARAINFVSTTTGNQITCAGKTLGTVTFNGAGGAWTLQDNFAAAGSVSLTLTAGTLSTNGQTLTLVSLVSTGSVARTLDMTGSPITCSGTGTAWNAGGTNLTITPTGSTLTFTGAGCTLTMGTFTYNNLSVTSTGTITLGGAATFNGNVTFNGATTVNAGASITVLGVFTLGPTALAFKSSVGGTARTIALSTTGSAVLTNVTFTDIAFTGTAAPVDGYTGTCVDGGGNSGINFTAPATFTPQVRTY